MAQGPGTRIASLRHREGERKGREREKGDRGREKGDRGREGERGRGGAEKERRASFLLKDHKLYL